MEFGDGVRTLLLGPGVARGTDFLSDGDPESCNGVVGVKMQTGPWATAYSGNQHRIRMTILQGWLQRLVFGCVIRVTPAWDGNKLVLGRGPRMLMLYLVSWF